ncbi:MAG: hypothetical protein JWQ38_1528 [Flavipsychrobacter sp.]|nr:hypothetical protein [Flavipsychrobacter sp.]
MQIYSQNYLIYKYLMLDIIVLSIMLMLCRLVNH